MLSELKTSRGAERTDVVIGSDLVMTVRDGRIALQTHQAAGRRAIGEYSSAAAAWEAIDAIDVLTEISAAA